MRGVGASPASAFEQAAVGLTAVITDPEGVDTDVTLTIRCRAPDRELLLTDWLNALIYEMATRRMLFGRFEVRIDGNELVARVWGEAINPDRHQPAVEAKGATYTELSVRQSAVGDWVAQCVVDV